VSIDKVCFGYLKVSLAFPRIFDAKLTTKRLHCTPIIALAFGVQGCELGPACRWQDCGFVTRVETVGHWLL